MLDHYQLIKNLRKTKVYTIDLIVTDYTIKFAFTEFIYGTHDLYRTFETLADLNKFLLTEYNFIKPIGKDLQAQRAADMEKYFKPLNNH